MSEIIRITGSIVVFKESLEELNKAIQCFVKSPNTTKLYLIENHKTIFGDQLLADSKIEILKPGKNIGFGAGHNLALKHIESTSDYHLILNPDVVFNPEVLSELLLQFQTHDEVMMVAPKVLFPNGELQHSCRRYPSFFELILRRVFLLRFMFNHTYRSGVYSDLDLNQPFYAEYLTGCFHLYKTKDLLALNGFDERYFLYMEDVDICKKIDEIGKKKLFYPLVSIHHVLKRGSSKNLLLFMRHLISVLKYFIKWGFR